MEKYSSNPNDTFGNNQYGNCLNEEFVNLLGNYEVPFFASKIGITYPEKEYFVKRKVNDGFTLEYVIDGVGYVEADGQVQTVSAGDVYLLVPGRPHKYWADKDKPFKKIWINFYSSMFSGVVSSLGLDKQVVYHPDTAVLPLFEKALSIVEACNVNDFVYLELSQIVYSIFTAIATPIANKSADSDSVARKAYTLINTRIFTNVKIKDIADVLFVSEEYVIKQFKKEFGITPHKYLMEKRLNAAKNLLKNTTLSIHEIAQKLNFEDEYYFSIFFKTKTGLPPTRFREAIKNN